MDEPHIRIEVLNSEGDAAPVERGIGGWRGRVRIPLGLIRNGVEVVHAAQKRFELVAQLMGGSEVRQRGLAAGIIVLYKGTGVPADDVRQQQRGPTRLAYWGPSEG